MQTPSLLDIVLEFLRGEDWAFIQAANTSLLRLSFSGDEDEWPCLGQVHEEEKIFLFYSLCPFVPSAPRCGAVAEFVTRANVNMIIGNFEMDMDSRLVRYKTSIDVQGDRLTTALVERVVFGNVLAMNRYLPGLKAVEQGADPAAAISKIENSDGEQRE